MGSTFAFAFGFPSKWAKHRSRFRLRFRFGNQEPLQNNLNCNHVNDSRRYQITTITSSGCGGIVFVSTSIVVVDDMSISDPFDVQNAPLSQKHQRRKRHYGFNGKPFAFRKIAFDVSVSGTTIQRNSSCY